MSEMIKIQNAVEMTPELRAHLTPLGHRHLGNAALSLDSYIALSSDVRYVSENDRPLFLIGAFQPTLFSPQKEVWMYSTEFLKAIHFRTVRKMWQEWLETQKGFLIFARTDSPQSERMVEFVGFTFRLETEHYKVYEVSP